ncbi:MAG: cystathionine gamma-synthase [Maricaulaceae bacterium]
MASKDKRTQTVQAEIGNDTAYGAVTPPIYLSSTYKFEQFDQQGQFDYGRGGNPNRNGLARAIAQLEGGAMGIVTASGMAAIDLATNLLSSDDLILAPHDCYGGTHRLLTHRAIQGRFRTEFVDQGDLAAFEKALELKPSLILVETPSNPLMRLVDIKAICKAAKRVGALVVVDNTFLSPARQTPLALGADFVVHSTTKYLNGHSDVVGGALVAKDEALGEKLAWWANCTGVTGAPFDAYLTLRGMRTLHARMDMAEGNALALATWLEGHKAVSHVYYPGLPSDAGYKLAQAQQSGPGAMLSFTVKGGQDAAKALLENARVFQMAESLGGVESLMCHPATMTHRGMEPEARETAGVGEDLIRISVGLEALEDLKTDLEVSLSSI